ncbi:MAG: ImmA/IrrE family metallo-endopeptidase [Hyphomicrobiaceae bacterium]|nr:ImmA/IrrE family metallo-endopeptidase [Hyphomicrobiaceae bacterium]
MAGFRLKLATQTGEKVAMQAGFTSFPIRPLKIAQDNEIHVEAKPPDAKGISGALIFANDLVTLIYSTEHDNRGFENFSIAHELGHFFLPGHPEEIMNSGGAHVSRANFTENTSIELEADHFASGLLLPSNLTRAFLQKNQVGLDGIIALAAMAECSLTAAAIRAAECCPYPVAVVVSQADKVAYAFMTDSFKALGKLTWLRKGTPLPSTATKNFNSDGSNVLGAARTHRITDLCTWFDGDSRVALDEEVIGLGKYGYTLTILSGEELPDDPDQEEDEEADLIEQWTPRFAYKR